MRLLIATLTISLFISACTQQKSETLKNTTWRATLTNEAGVELPFTFEVGNVGEKQMVVVKNGEEEIVADELYLNGDSFHLKMPIFDSEIVATLKNNTLKGEWLKHYGDTKTVSMPFSAIADEDYRFSKSPSPANANISGKWDVTFLYDGKDTTKAIGEFKQEGNKLTGTFLTATGDYRFLEGDVDGSQVSLSCFDGSHAFIFTAKINDAGELVDGSFYSGTTYHENWTAVKNENVTLPDAYALTYLKEGYDKFDFSFPNLKGDTISLADSKFEGKAMIIQIMGSWCPNCMDETQFLSDFYEEKPANLEIVALAYEHSPKFEIAAKSVKRLKARFGVDYPLLIAGTSSKKEAAETLPMLNHILSFPTTIFLNQKHEVVKIHTGFSGPGTGEYYEKWLNEFNKTINEITAS